MRMAWVMKLKPGNEAIYKQKHDEIWPEMLDQMEREGINNFSIYRYGLLLFAYLERDSAPRSDAAAQRCDVAMVEDDGGLHGV